MRDHDSANNFLVLLLCSFLVCAMLGLVSPAISNAEDEDSSYDSRAGEDDTQDQDQDSDYKGESAEDEYTGYDNDGGDQEEAYSDVDDGQETPQPTMGTTHHDDEVTISEDEIVTVNVLSNDGLVLGHRGSPTISEVSSPSFGTVIVNYDNTITYAPFQTPLPAGYEKHDSFQYTVSFYDGSLYTGTITIWINQTNDPPIAYSAEYTTVKNKPLRFVLPAHDEDNDDLTFVILTNTTFGELDLDPRTGQVVYTPHEKYDGRDRLTFTVSDGTTSSSVATIELIISDMGGSSSTIGQQPADNPDDEEDDPGPEQNSTGVNSKPIADAGPSFSIIAGNEIALDGNSSHDPDGDALTFSWSQEDGPDASLDRPTLASPTIIAPEVDSETTMTFKLVVSDGLLSSDPSFVIVTIIPVDIDVIPSIYPNKIYLSEPDVEIPVAIIGSASLNASSVDEETLTFGPGFAPAISFELVDFNSDGYTDLVSYHRTGDLGLQEEDKTACLSGSIEMNSDDVFEFSICRNVKVFE